MEIEMKMNGIFKSFIHFIYINLWFGIKKDSN